MDKLLYFMANPGAQKICGNGDADLSAVFGILGWVVLGIKIVVPILLILFGMLQMATAVMSQKEDAIKKAQSGLINKIIAAVVVFLVVTLVTFLMSIIGDDNWKACMDCLNSPTDCPISNE